MAGKTNGNGAAGEAKFVFKGTIQKLDASALTQVPKDEPTVIVHVDEILQAPPALAKTLGKQITVKLAKGAKPKVGEQVLFYANGWLFGDTVAVESVKQEKSAMAKTMLAERVSDPVRNLADRELQDRAADADMVVEGQVSSIHLPQAESFAATRSANAARPVSEHDPKWREAVIDVGAVHRGNPGTKQVVVRFPSSNDVQWHRAPKFRTGDRGVWLLHSPEKSQDPGEATKRTAIAAAALPGATVYTALSPMDFQPAHKLDTVAPIIRGAVARSAVGDSLAAPTRELVTQNEATATRKVSRPVRSRKQPAGGN